MCRRGVSSHTSLNFFICKVGPHLRVGTWKGQRKEGPRAGRGSGVLWPVLGLATFHGLRYGCDYPSQSHLEPQLRWGQESRNNVASCLDRHLPEEAAARIPSDPRAARGQCQRLWLRTDTSALPSSPQGTVPFPLCTSFCVCPGDLAGTWMRQWGVAAPTADRGCSDVCGVSGVVHLLWKAGLSSFPPETGGRGGLRKGQEPIMKNVS